MTLSSKAGQALKPQYPWKKESPNTTERPDSGQQRIKEAEARVGESRKPGGGQWSILGYGWHCASQESSVANTSRSCEISFLGNRGCSVSLASRYPVPVEIALGKKDCLQQCLFGGKAELLILLPTRKEPGPEWMLRSPVERSQPTPSPNSS